MLLRRRMPARARLPLAACATAAPLLGACERAPAKAPPPATVQGAVAEGQLTTVRLTAEAVRRLGIETVLVDSADVTPTRTVGGEIVVPPGQALTVAAPVAGTVFAPATGAIPAAGTRVAAGQPLMRLVALPPDLARTQQDVAVAQARLRQAQLEADRVAGLYADRLVAGRDQERAQADLAAARAAYELAAGQQRAGRGGARRDASGLAALTITAPSDGVVRALGAAPGQAVTAGAPLAEIVRLDQLWVRVPLYAGDARLVGRADATVETLGTAPGGTGPRGTAAALRAVPVAAPPSADPTAASVDLFYALPGGSLRPGERVSVTLPLTGPRTATGAASERALVVPLTALVRDLSGGAWVYVRSDSLTFARRRVEVARVADGRAILAAGPPQGARVVTAGAAELFGTEFGAGK